MRQSSSTPSHLASQLGVYAVEFAFVFILLFMIIYGLLTFGMVFAAQQSLNLAAQEGAHSLLRYQDRASPTDQCIWGDVGSGERASFSDRAVRAQACILDQADWIEQLAQGINHHNDLVLNIAICGRQGAILVRGTGTCMLSPQSLASNEVEVTVSYEYAQQPLIPDFGLVYLYKKTMNPTSLSNTQRIRISGVTTTALMP